MDINQLGFSSFQFKIEKVYIDNCNYDIALYGPDKDNNSRVDESYIAILEEFDTEQKDITNTIVQTSSWIELLSDEFNKSEEFKQLNANLEFYVFDGNINITNDRKINFEINRGLIWSNYDQYFSNNDIYIDEFLAIFPPKKSGEGSVHDHDLA